MRRMRMYEEIMEMQAEANRFFDDVTRRLMFFERALGRWSAIPDDSDFEREMKALIGERDGQERAARIDLTNAPVSCDRATTSLDIYEDDDEMIAEIAVPGLRPNDLTISVSGNSIVLRGVFSHTIELPDDMDAEQIRAHYRNVTPLPAETRRARQRNPDSV